MNLSPDEHSFYTPSGQRDKDIKTAEFETATKKDLKKNSFNMIPGYNHQFQNHTNEKSQIIKSNNQNADYFGKNSPFRKKNMKFFFRSQRSKIYIRLSNK